MSSSPAPRAAASDFHAFVADEATIETVIEAARVAGLSDSEIHLGGVTSALDELSREGAPSILLVDLSGSDDMVDTLDRLAEQCEQHTRLVALGLVNDVDLYRQLIDMGVTDYLVKPASSQAIAVALQRAARAPESPPPLDEGTRARQVVALIGSRGGVGATTIATAIAWGMAHQQRRQTVLIDLDLHFGSVAMSLDLEPSRGMREILSNPDRIDTLLIASAASQESERLRVLSAEEGLDSQIVAGEQGLTALLDALSPDADQIVVDVPRRLDAPARAALGQAQIVCIVADLSLVSMRDTKRLLKLCASLNPGAKKVLIGNRIGGVSGEVPQKEFERGIEAGFDYLLPEDEKAAAVAADEGKTLLDAASGRPLAAELGRLIGRLTGSAEAQPEKSTGKSLLGRLLGS